MAALLQNAELPASVHELMSLTIPTVAYRSICRAEKEGAASLRTHAPTQRTRAAALDSETFRIPPLMSKRTIRIPDEGWWRCRRDLRLRRYDRAAVKQKSDRNLNLSKMPTSSHELFSLR